MRIGLVGILSTLEVGLSGTRAVMHRDDEGGWVGELGGFVDEHLDACGVRAEVRDLLELTSSGKRANCAKQQGGERLERHH